jgi:type IV secretory pathway VirB9-like protein
MKNKKILILVLSLITRYKKNLTLALSFVGVVSVTILAFAQTGDTSKSSTQSSSSSSSQLPASFGTVGSTFDNSNDDSAADSDVQQCKIINWVGNRVYTIKGSMNMGTHIVFPEASIDVVVGNKSLWTEEHEANHVFIKPNTNKSDGEQTTLTYIGESNASYEFIIKRVSDSENVPCVVITRNGKMLNYTAWNNYKNKDKEVIKYLATQFGQQKKQIISQQQNALDKYRGSIYTGYKWNSSGSWFGNNFVSDVYDDGRWTYVRVSNDNKGVMSIYGVLNSKKTILEFSYDESTKLYRISGIYPQIILAYGKDSVTITRQSA